MRRQIILAIFSIGLVLLAPLDGRAQGRGTPNPLRLITHTTYTPTAEMYAVYRPFIVGQESRFSAHLTRIADHFIALPVTSRVTMTMTLNGKRTEQVAAAERPGVFRANFTAAEPGTASMAIVVTTPEGTERFSVDNIPVEPDLQRAISHQGPAPSEAAPVRYTKEDGWDSGVFATAAVGKVAIATGQPAVIAVPRTAILRDQDHTRVYVQRNPEAFDLRDVTTASGNDRYVAISSGVQEGERIVVLGAEKLPRK